MQSSVLRPTAGTISGSMDPITMVMDTVAFRQTAGCSNGIKDDE